MFPKHRSKNLRVHGAETLDVHRADAQIINKTFRKTKKKIYFLASNEGPESAKSVKKVPDIGICRAVLVSEAQSGTAMQHAVRPRRALDLAATRPIVLRASGGAIDTQAFDTTVAQGISGAGTLAVGDISHFSATLGGGPVSVAAGANLELGMEA